MYLYLLILCYIFKTEIFNYTTNFIPKSRGEKARKIESSEFLSALFYYIQILHTLCGIYSNQKINNIVCARDSVTLIYPFFVLAQNLNLPA